jgi:phosphatidylserine/phosphatidylglycerophosphate/cardiolipin synthase-like enzyme
MPPTVPKHEILIGANYRRGIVPLIDEAKNSIDILMFDWRWYFDDVTSDVSLITQAIARAVDRGVKVRVITSREHIAEKLEDLNIQAKAWTHTRFMHAKALVIDQEIIIMGSHNFSNSAMKYNVEISVKITERILAGQLGSYFNSLWIL